MYSSSSTTFTNICAEQVGRQASLDDVEDVYTGDMLGVRGQMDLEHYESRLKTILGREGYRTALEILTAAAVNGGVLGADSIGRYRDRLPRVVEAAPILIDDLLHVLEHDGYLARQGDGYRFVSGLLEDWWRTRYGRHGTSSPADSGKS